MLGLLFDHLINFLTIASFVLNLPPVRIDHLFDIFDISHSNIAHIHWLGPRIGIYQAGSLRRYGNISSRITRLTTTVKRHDEAGTKK